MYLLVTEIQIVDPSFADRASLSLAEAKARAVSRSLRGLFINSARLKHNLVYNLTDIRIPSNDWLPRRDAWCGQLSRAFVGHQQPTAYSLAPKTEGCWAGMSAASVAPERCVGSTARKSISAAESLEGRLKTSSTRRLPNSEGTPCTGMPSSRSVSTWWGWLTPALAIVTEWPSRWRMVREKPRSAWLG